MGIQIYTYFRVQAIKGCWIITTEQTVGRKTVNSIAHYTRE